MDLLLQSDVEWWVPELKILWLELTETFLNYNLGTPWVVAAEIFPQHVRPASQAFVSASNW
jgi:hypothetical protein